MILIGRLILSGACWRCLAADINPATPGSKRYSRPDFTARPLENGRQGALAIKAGLKVKPGKREEIASAQAVRVTVLEPEQPGALTRRKNSRPSPSASALARSFQSCDTVPWQ